MAKIVLKNCCLNSALFEEVVAVYCLDRLSNGAVFQVNISMVFCLFVYDRGFCRTFKKMGRYKPEDRGSAKVWICPYC